MSEKFESFFGTRCVEGDGPGEIPSIGTIHSFRGSPGKEIVGLQVVKTCREEVRKKVEETRKWREVNCFICRAGDGRKPRIEAGPPQGVRLSIERDLDKAGEETRESRDRHVKGVLHIQGRENECFSHLSVIARKKRKTELRKDTAFTRIRDQDDRWSGAGEEAECRLEG